MTDSDKEITQHCGSDLVDICIQINVEIRIRILDHIWLRLDALAEVSSFCLDICVYRVLWHSLFLSSIFCHF